MMRWQTFVSIFLPSVVESVCTMFFVLIGCSSTISWPQEETGPNLVSISLCFGLSYAFLVNISNCFSNGFINPAITMALVVNKTLSVTRGFCFILAHLVGGKIFSQVWRGCLRISDLNLQQRCLVRAVKASLKALHWLWLACMWHCMHWMQCLYLQCCKKMY